MGSRYAQVLIETFTEGHYIQDKKEMPDFEFSGKRDAYGINRHSNINYNL